MKRASWLYAAPAAALAAVWGPSLLAPWSWVPSSPFGDLPARFAPLRAFGFGELAAGRLPLWNPRVFGGLPNVGGLESALFYPPNWLHLLLPPAAAFNLVLFGHLWLAAALTMFWARRRGASPEAALLAGCSWALSGAVFPRLFAGHVSILCALAWTPLLFCAVDRWLEERRLVWLFAAAAASALQWLSGNPQTAYYALLAAGLLAAARARRALPALSVLAAAAGGGAALAAVQLLPGLEAARESARAGSGAAFAGAFSLPPESLLSLVAPHWLGGDALPYAGRLFLWEASLFVGAVPLALAAAAPARERRALWPPAAALLVLALGARTPLHGVLCAALPGFALFRGPAKFAAPLLLLVCAAAAAGWDRLRAEPRARARAAAGCAAAAAAFALLAAGAWAAAPGRWARALSWLAMSGETWADPRLYADAGFAAALGREAALSLAGAALAFAAAAAACARGRVRVLGAVAGAQLLWFAWARGTACAPRQPVPEPLQRALEADASGARFLSDWTRHPNLSMLLGRDEVWGYDQLPTRRWAELGAWTQGRSTAGAGLYQTLAPTARLRLMRAGWLWRDEPAGVSRLPAPLPRVFLARAVTAPRGGELAAMSSPSFDPAVEAVVAEGDAPAGTRKPRGRVSWREASSDELLIEAETDAPALLVVADAYSSGWRADPYAVVPADHALRGVPLSPGRHAVRLRYAPRSWRAGAALSLLSLLVLLGAAAFAARAKRD